MKKLLLIILLLNQISNLFAQATTDSLNKGQLKANADDPSNFFTRVEVFNEFQQYGNGFNLNQTTLRSIWKLGKRFTTRIDLPYVNNSNPNHANYKQSGLGDISFRLLGYKLRENPRAAFTISMEVSLNTAESPLLGTGKNLLIPVLSYSSVIPKKKMLFSGVLQQVISVGGDDARANISFSKIQIIFVKHWTRRLWTVVAPEWFIDYINDGLSMNFRSRLAYAPTPRINVWVTPSAGIFGDFGGRYKWSLDVGGRYFLFREMNFKKKDKA